MAAYSYASAMRMLVIEVNAPGKHHLGAPFALLAGFALELGFKAVIASQGANEDELRSIGHSIERAMSRAEDAGLRPRDRGELERIVNLLELPHRQLQMRYIPGGVESITLPGPEAALSAISHLLDDIWIQYPVIERGIPGGEE